MKCGGDGGSDTKSGGRGVLSAAGPTRKVCVCVGEGGTVHLRPDTKSGGGGGGVLSGASGPIQKAGRGGGGGGGGGGAVLQKRGQYLI